MIRIGVDFGGTKIEAAALGADGGFVSRLRAPNPGDYRGAIETVRGLVLRVEAEAGATAGAIGVGMPGSISPANGLVRGANSVFLNGMAFDKDLAVALERPVRVQNDANCFTLSEAIDGAARGAGVVFGVIIGTGCGGGMVVNGALADGHNRMAGEWGHTPLPWPTIAERDALPCWCGRAGCLERYVSGTGFCDDFESATGRRLTGEAIAAAARAGEAEADAALERYIDRLARGLAVVCDILDPDVIVCGGGMSNVTEIYDRVGPIIARNVFSDVFDTRVAPALHGDSSGVRGAAWLWPAV